MHIGSISIHIHIHTPVRHLVSSKHTLTMWVFCFLCLVFNSINTLYIYNIYNGTIYTHTPYITIHSPVRRLWSSVSCDDSSYAAAPPMEDRIPCAAYHRQTTTQTHTSISSSHTHINIIFSFSLRLSYWVYMGY